MVLADEYGGVKSEYSERLCVPPCQALCARNRNFAISGVALTASMVANSVSTSTPLALGRGVVTLMVVS